MWVRYSGHGQGDPEVFGHQLGSEQGVGQGGRGAVVPFIHHSTEIALAIHHFLFCLNADFEPDAGFQFNPNKRRINTYISSFSFTNLGALASIESSYKFYTSYFVYQ